MLAASMGTCSGGGSRMRGSERVSRSEREGQVEGGGRGWQRVPRDTGVAVVIGAGAATFWGFQCEREQ